MFTEFFYLGMFSYFLFAFSFSFLSSASVSGVVNFLVFLFPSAKMYRAICIVFSYITLLATSFIFDSELLPVIFASPANCRNRLFEIACAGLLCVAWKYVQP